MRKTIKRIFASLLTVVMLLTAAPLSGFVGLDIDFGWLDFSTKSSALSSGSCGDNVTYTFDSSTGLLTISGTGYMMDYSSAPYSPFYKNGSIKSVIINSGVTSIGDYVFYNCTGLTSITIHNGVTSIGDYSFCKCTALTSVTIPDSVTSIGVYAFSGCTGLTSITIPASIGDSAFFNCTSLKRVTILDSVTSIDSEAFRSCTSLISITIPDSVTWIGEGVFMNCSGLTSVTVESNNKVYDSRENCNAIIRTKTNKLIQGCKNTTIPDNVTSIDGFAFTGCTGLTSITIPDSVTRIGGSAFECCTGLTSVTIGDRVTIIGGAAFEYCTSLTSITIPDSVTSIGNHAFYNCTSLTSVTIGNCVTNIGSFVFNYCTGLTRITVDSNNTVYDSRKNCNAIIETETNTLIQGCKNTIIPDSVTSIGISAFRNCTDLTSITIPDGVTSIGEYAFYGCKGLTSIIIPNSVTRIALSVFSDCTALKDVYYSGTEEQWNAISFGSSNGYLLNANIHYNSSSGENPGDDNPDIPTDRVAHHGKLDNYVTTVVLNGSEQYVSEIIVDGVTYKVKKGTISLSYAENIKGGNVSFVIKDDEIVFISKDEDICSGAVLGITGDTVLGYSYYKDNKFTKNSINIELNIYNSLSINSVYPDKEYAEEAKMNYAALAALDELKIYVSSVDVSVSGANAFDVSEKQSINIPINEYIPLGGSIKKDITVNVKDSFVPDSYKINSYFYCKMSFKSGETTSVCENTHSVQITNYNLAPYVSDDPSGDSSTDDDQLAKKAAYELKELQSSTANGVISLDGSADLIGLLGSDTLEAIGAKMLSIIVLASAPKETFDEVLTDTVIEKVFGAKKWFQIWNNKVAFDVVVNTKDYGEVKIRFTSENPVYNFNGKDLGSFGFVMYEITGNKKALKKLKEKNFPITGTAGGFATYDMDAFCQAAYSFVKSELKKSYNIAYGNDLNKAVDFVFGKSVNKLLSYTKYGSVSGLYWEFLTIAGKEYKIECPVDVYIYDSENNIVAAVENNKEVLSNDNVEIEINGDTKYIRLYNDSYRIVYMATANGSMRVTVNELVNLDTSLRTVVIDDIPLNAGLSYTQSADNELLEDSDYSLYSNDGSSFTPDSDKLNFHDHVSCGVWYDGDTSTCTERGCKWTVCSICNEWYKEYLDYADHVDNNGDGHCDECGTVVSTPETAKVKSVSVGDITLNYKKSATITPIIDADEGAEYTVTYTSSNPSVARVDENGKVYGAKKGSADITVTVTDSYGNSVSDTCKVNVKYSFGQWLIVIVLFGWIWY